MEDLDIIYEFVIESSENLARLDREMVELEKRPNDSNLLASIFRTIHTIKGTCGFLGFSVLERITHHAENILSQVRNGERELTGELVSLILETVDAIRLELTSIETTSRESGAGYEDLIERQEAAATLDAAAQPLPEKELEQVTAPVFAPPAFVEPEPRAAQPESVPPAAASDPVAAPDNDDAAIQKHFSAADSTIRVDVAQLDKLMNLVGELVLARNQILQFNEVQVDAAFNATSQRLNLITTELQEGVMKTRMQPIGMVWSKLPRVVRDLAASCGKQISLEMEGAETELDKAIIEAIKDPLTHIVRNSCDHGIESPDGRVKSGKLPQGKLVLRAFHEGGNVIIEIADDGGGIDPQKIKRSAIEKGLMNVEQAERMRDSELLNLVFLPGFSTAAKISNISGRGVGMDVVKTNIEKIGGAVDLASRIGLGTTVKVRIPLTLAIIPGLVVMAGGERFVIPQASLIELLRVEGNQGPTRIEWLYDAPICRRRGGLLPLVFLNDALKLGESQAQRTSDVFNIIVLQAEDRQFGLVVDSINDTQEIVVKPLGKQLKGVQCYAGATIMGDGKVALILDVLGLAQFLAVSADARTQGAEGRRTNADQENQKQSLLLFRAGGFERLAVPLSLVARLEEIPRERLERAAGRTVIQYRGQILPLVQLGEHLGGSSSNEDGAEASAQVIVFSDSDRQIGLVVDQILDIVEDTVTMQRSSDRPGVLGSAVVGQKIIDFLDLQGVIQEAENGWFDKARARLRKSTVLLVEGSAFARSLLRTSLEIAGHQVLEASTTSEALEKLKKQGADVMVASLDLPEAGMLRLLESLKNEPLLCDMPIVALTADGESMQSASEVDSAFSVCLNKLDRASILRSIENLATAVDRAQTSRSLQKERVNA